MGPQNVDVHMARFEESRSRTSDYPANLVRTEAYHHTLEAYREKLNGRGIFDPKYRSLMCIDLYENNDAFHKWGPIDTEHKLSGHIDEEDGAPLWRMVFLHSRSSRGALGCSKGQLTILLTYYQVMPSFLDFILTFCTRERPVAHALFRSENYLEKNTPEFALPELRRSGIQIQHAFNLLSVERAGNPGEKTQWPLRQVALYHSFDVGNGRCFWIILKGNTLMAKRIFSAMEHQRRLKATDITSPETSFIAALQVQAIMVDWCSESWAEYIDHLEEVVSTNSVEGKTAPVDQVTSLTEIEHMHSARGTNTFDTQSRAASSPTSPRRWTFRQSSSDLFTVIRRLSGLESTMNQDDANDIEAPAEAQEEEEDERDRLSDLERDFSFQKFQRMSELALELERAMVVLEQNKGVLTAIEEHYRSVVNSYGFTTNMKEGACGGDLTAFFAKIRSIERDLDMHYRRLQTLSRVLENDKAVFTTLLQYKSEKVSEYFASSAKISSERMEDIAVRTEQETVSMHVITVFTLIFLPGTFIAVGTRIPRLCQDFLTLGQTLFSSGVFHWDDDGTLGSDWVIRRNALKLFFSVSLPMMAIIVTVWSLLYIYMRRKRQQKQKLRYPIADEQATQDNAEKGLLGPRRDS